MVKKIDEKRKLEEAYCQECGSLGMKRYHKNTPDRRKLYQCQTSRKCRPVLKVCYEKPQILPEFDASRVKKTSRVILSAVLNDTPIVKDFDKTLRRMEKELDAELVYGLIRYKNPDAKNPAFSFNYTWPEEILDKSCEVDLKIGPGWWARGENVMNYTDINPLSGMNHAGGTDSEIFFSPQVALQSVPTRHGQESKLLMTTGTISRENYSKTKRGKKAKFHHSLSALYIEFDEKGRAYPTQIHWDGKGCYLYGRYFHPRGSSRSKTTQAIVFGDIHKHFLSKKEEIGLHMLADSLNPHLNIFGDLHHHVDSHHTRGSVKHNLKREHNPRTRVEAELKEAVEFLRSWKNPHIVESNHDDHLEKWLDRFDPTKDKESSLYWWLGHHMDLDIQAGGNGNLLRIYLEHHCDFVVDFIHANDGFMIGPILMDQHGNRGPNGSRGSAQSFAKTGHKMIVGHGHSPCIEKGCYMVGVAAMHQDYAEGMGSWRSMHAVLYDNHKRALVQVYDDNVPPTLLKLAA